MKLSRRVEICIIRLGWSRDSRVFHSSNRSSLVHVSEFQFSFFGWWTFQSVSSFDSLSSAFDVWKIHKSDEPRSRLCWNLEWFFFIFYFCVLCCCAAVIEDIRKWTFDLILSKNEKLWKVNSIHSATSLLMAHHRPSLIDQFIWLSTSEWNSMAQKKVINKKDVFEGSCWWRNIGASS